MFLLFATFLLYSIRNAEKKIKKNDTFLTLKKMSSIKDSLNSLIQILSLKFPEDSPDIQMNDEFSILVSPIVFPKLTQQDLQIIQNNIQTAQNFTDALNGVNYYFPLVPIILQLMNDLVDNSSANLEYCSYFTLCSYITWRLYVELTNNFENLPLLLDCFVFSSYSSQKKLIIQVYIQAVYFYLNSTAPFDLSYIFPTLSDFIISGRKEAIPVQCLFQPILTIFIPQQDSNVPKDCEELLRWLSALPQDSYALFTDETIKNILEKLFYHASLLHLPVMVFSFSLKLNNPSLSLRLVAFITKLGLYFCASITSPLSLYLMLVMAHALYLSPTFSIHAHPLITKHWIYS